MLIEDEVLLIDTIRNHSCQRFSVESGSMSRKTVSLNARREELCAALQIIELSRMFILMLTKSYEFPLYI